MGRDGVGRPTSLHLPIPIRHNPSGTTLYQTRIQRLIRLYILYTIMKLLNAASICCSCLLFAMLVLADALGPDASLAELAEREEELAVVEAGKGASAEERPGVTEPSANKPEPHQPDPHRIEVQSENINEQPSPAAPAPGDVYHDAFGYENPGEADSEIPAGNDVFHNRKRSRPRCAEVRQKRPLRLWMLCNVYAAVT